MILFDYQLHNEYTKNFSVFHILYIIGIIAAVVFSLILIKKKVKSEKAIDLILLIGAISLLVINLANKISTAYYDVNTSAPKEVFGKEVPYRWRMVFLPFTFCSATSFILGITLLFNRKDSFILHMFFIPILIGGIANVFYPEYLSRQNIWEARTWGALLHHILALWLVLVMLLTGRYKPTIKKWFYPMIGLLIFVAFGYFELLVLGFSEAMNIATPLVGMYWYHMLLIEFVLNFIWLFIWEMAINKKKFKEVCVGIVKLKEN